MQVLTPSAVRERVGFVVPRWTTTNPGLERQGIPFRCFPVAGSLYNHGYEVVYFDQELDLELHDRFSELRKELESCRIVFFWTNELWPQTQYLNLVLLIKHVKSWYPEIMIAVGGTLITVLPPEMFYVGGPVEFFIRGYGEHVCTDLLKALDGGARLEDVSGLVWRENGVHRHNAIGRSKRLQVDNNEILYRLLDLTDYIQRGGIFGNDQGTFIIGTGQGCVKGCGFCVWRNEPPSLLRSEPIVNLVKFLRDRYGVLQYHLAELDLFTNRRRALALAKAWQEQVPDCIWFALISPEDMMKFTDEELDFLVEGGCRKLEIGSESGSAEILNAIGKGHTPEDTVILHRKLLDRGIHALYNFIFAFPGETEKDQRDSTRQIETLYRMDPLRVSFAFRILQAIPNTPIGDKALEKVHDFPKTIDEIGAYRPLYSDYNTRTMPWIEPGDERHIKRMVKYTLPIATSRLPCPNKMKELLYRTLRRVAWWRLRRGFWTWEGLDERLYTRFLGRSLSETYRP